MTAIKSVELPQASPLIHPKISSKVVNPDSIEAMTRETDRNVHGTFINIECPGQPARICCKYYRGQEFFAMTMLDNEKYKIPLSVARHINERCYHEPHSYLVDDKGNPVKTGKKQFRYKFMIEG